MMRRDPYCNDATIMEAIKCGNTTKYNNKPHYKW